MGALRVVALLAVALLAAAASRAESDESKRELIVELIGLSAAAQSTEELANVFLAQVESRYPLLVEEVMGSETELSAEQRDALRKELSDFDAFAAAFLELFPERVRLQEVMETVYVPLYEEAFTEEELRAIVAFYRSPAGRKTLTVMPAIVQQGFESSVPLVEPRVIALVGEVLARRRAKALP